MIAIVFASRYIIIVPDKAFFSQSFDIFLISPKKNICFGYSLEVPRQALLMSAHNMCVLVEKKKKKKKKYLPDTHFI